MVVEDEPLTAFDNEHLLRDSGYEVVATVDNVAAAREVIAREPLDLILTDIRLRGAGDGADVAREAVAAEIPVLFVTGHCPEEARVLAVGCLAKPYSDRTLKAALDAVDGLLSGRRSKRVPPGLTIYEKEEG